MKTGRRRAAGGQRVGRVFRLKLRTNFEMKIVIIKLEKKSFKGVFMYLLLPPLLHKPFFSIP